jgi:hypothetical protein
MNFLRQIFSLVKKKMTQLQYNMCKLFSFQVYIFSLFKSIYFNLALAH